MTNCITLVQRGVFPHAEFSNAREYDRRFSRTLLYNFTLYYAHLPRTCRIALNIFTEFLFTERKIRSGNENRMVRTWLKLCSCASPLIYQRFPCTTVYHLFSSSIKRLSLVHTIARSGHPSRPPIPCHTIRNFSRLPPLTQAKFYREQSSVAFSSW